MKILLLEPFFAGSHRAWAEGYQKHSCHEVHILSLPGRHWKWRMAGGAVAMAENFLASAFKPDLILATDMLDLTTFLSLTRKQTANIPTAIYFHENQINYPWSPDDPDKSLQRDHHYGFINYTSALAADKIFFNSAFHREAFLAALPDFLKMFPDQNSLTNVERIAQKSEVLPLGLDLNRFLKFQNEVAAGPPKILWNHRWEYDKDPDTFFEIIFRMADESVDFQLVVLGESYAKTPPVFEKAKKKLAGRILHFGFAERFEDYAEWLWSADILPVTSRQDFFGISAVEAIFCNCFPLLPERLAFPEHIPDAFKHKHFYTDAGDLFEKLKAACQNINELRASPDYQNFVARYDWTIFAPLYDERFSRLF